MMLNSLAPRPLQTRFQGHLWVNLSKDPRPLSERLEDAKQQWNTALEQGACPALEHEVHQEEKTKGSMDELKRILNAVFLNLSWPEGKTLRIQPNRTETQARINYGHNEPLREALKKGLRSNGILYFDTEKAFHCNLQALASPAAEPFASLEGRVGKLLLDLKMKVTTAESCTGGLISSRLTDVLASGNFVEYSDIVYCNRAKREALGIPMDFLDTNGPYNPETARWMAEGSKNRSDVDVAISITGLAGNKPVDGVPAGTAYVGIAGLTPETQVFKVNLPADIPKERKKRLFSEFALFQLEKLLKAKKAERDGAEKLQA